MMEINDKLKEVIDKCKDNYYHIKEIHYLILNKKYSSVTKKLISKYKINQDEAKILVNYYKEKAKQKYLLIEITVGEAKVLFHDKQLRNPHPEDRMKSFAYHSQFKFLVLRGYGVKEVSLVLNEEQVSYMDSEDCMYVNIDEVRQIWKIEEK